MPALHGASALYVGTTTVSRVYLGDEIVWPIDDGDTGGGIRQQSSGTWDGVSMDVSLPGPSAATSVVALFVAGNTSVPTPAGWTRREIQLNTMGHYLFTREGGGASSWTIPSNAGTGTWYVAEIGNGEYDTSASAENTNYAFSYTTPSLVPSAGTRLILASIGAVHQNGTPATMASWTNGFEEVADICSLSADHPMQAVAAYTVDTDGIATYSTTGTYEFERSGRTAIIASFVTTTNSEGEAANLPPTASFTISATGLVATTNSSASTDSDGTIVSYDWNWGDSQTSSGANASHTYDTAGAYTVTLTVTDDDGATHSTTRGVTVTEGGFVPNIINNPSSGGYPDATNTGVPTGTTLADNGSATITVNTNGAIIENLNIVNGNIVVNANNVTIRNCRITTYAYYPIENNGTNLVVEDCEITGTEDTVAAAISFSGFTARRLNVSGSADGFKANADCVIEDCYVHDLRVTQDSHNDGIQTTGGNNVTVHHNTIDVNTAGVAVQFGSANSNWQITNNLIRATGWALNGGPDTSNCTVTNNRFAPVPGWYGAYSLGGGGNTYSGNIRDDTGAPI